MRKVRERRTGLAEHAEADAADRIRQPVGVALAPPAPGQLDGNQQQEDGVARTMIWLGLMEDTKMSADCFPDQVSAPLASTLMIRSTTPCPARPARRSKVVQVHRRVAMAGHQPQHAAQGGQAGLVALGVQDAVLVTPLA